MGINKEWHLEHLMPKNATLEQRIAWHREHLVNCDCRKLPKKLALEFDARGIPYPPDKVDK